MREVEPADREAGVLSALGSLALTVGRGLDCLSGVPVKGKMLL